jgi:ABC-type lipoprotein release transport system permease subunit
MQTTWNDLRYALRILRKNPGSTAAAIFTLALGVGATTAIFSVVYGVLLRPLPYRNPEQIVSLREQGKDGTRMNFTDPNFEDLRAQNHSLQGLAEYRAGLETVTGNGAPARLMTARVSHDFFQVMRVEPVVGRSFAPEEQQLNASPAAMISYAYWKQALGGTQELAAVRLKLDARPISIIGVLPAGFRFPDNADLWIPREVSERYPSRTAHNWEVIGRLRDEVSTTGTRTELSGIAQRLKQQYGQNTDMVAVALEPLRAAMTRDVRPALLILLGASGFLLLIACANVVNLMLAQLAAREKELSIRTAMGADRGRLVGQFLTEASVLSAVGGGLGVLLAYWGVTALVALAPANLPRLENVSISVPVLVFSFATVFSVSIALGMFTAMRSANSDPRIALVEGSQRHIGTLPAQRTRRVIAAGQLATALVLLVGAGLLARSLLRVMSVDSGFRIENVATMELGLPESPKLERIQFVNQLMTRLRQIPGVLQVGATNVLPLTGEGRADGSYVLMNPGQIPARTQELMQRAAAGSLGKDQAAINELLGFFDQIFHDQAHVGNADYAVVSDGFFKALGIPLLQGRLFDERDTLDAPHVAIVSASLAREKWPNQDPLGRTVEFGNMDGDPRLLTVVGVVGDVRDRILEVAPRPAIYVDYRQRPQTLWQFAAVMCTSGKPDGAFAAARRIVHDLDPNLAPEFRTLSQVYSSSLEARRFSLTLVGIFSVTALLLALAGIYGVISYSVAQRTREIGVRMALGATPREVLTMVLRQGAITAAIGIVVGMVASLALTRWLQSQLFEVSATDPATFLGVASLLIVVSLAACWLPGRRATKVDPMVALRYE